MHRKHVLARLFVVPTVRVGSAGLAVHTASATACTDIEVLVARGTCEPGRFGTGDFLGHIGHDPICEFGGPGVAAPLGRTADADTAWLTVGGGGAVVTMTLAIPLRQGEHLPLSLARTGRTAR